MKKICPIGGWVEVRVRDKQRPYMGSTAVRRRAKCVEDKCAWWAELPRKVGKPLGMCAVPGVAITNEEAVIES